MMDHNNKICSAFILFAGCWNLNLIIQHNANDDFLCYSLDTNDINNIITQTMSCVSASRIHVHTRFYALLQCTFCSSYPSSSMTS